MHCCTNFRTDNFIPEDFHEPLFLICLMHCLQFCIQVLPPDVDAFLLLLHMPFKMLKIRVKKIHFPDSNRSPVLFLSEFLQMRAQFTFERVQLFLFILVGFPALLDFRLELFPGKSLQLQNLGYGFLASRHGCSPLP